MERHEPLGRQPQASGGIAVQRDGGVLHVTLDRPDARNALTIAMRDGIVDAVGEARRDPDVRALLITGNGRAFFAGHGPRRVDRDASRATRLPPRA